jgi:hypothetical protein
MVSPAYGDVGETGADERLDPVAEMEPVPMHDRHIARGRVRGRGVMAPGWIGRQVSGSRGHDVSMPRPWP